ncbi:hypothetical protein LSH36_1492g00009 [Paralvinella palmiformis]|uniref:Protein lin-52 homolog n=1 Tax=Paralvinella palmiformis TaxID=53620 RepID=A0AAD9IT07_9ANNE|nr:hypothetical protein LSH36_1492g00009 [Paralvinella palmiformis]
MDSSLFSLEKMRASPELWPEQIPGVSGFAAVSRTNSPETSPQKRIAELGKDDIDLIQEFASLTTAQLLEKVRGLQNLAYQLGMEEGMAKLACTQY